MMVGRKRVRPDRYKVFTRRALLLGGIQGALLSTLVARLYHLQVVENKKYQMLSDENRISVRLLAPPRGRITDRFGQVMAANRADYRAFLIPEQTENIDVTLNAISRILPLTLDDRARIEETVKKQRSFMPVTIAGNLSWDNFAKLNMEFPDLPGIQPDVGTTRFYPYGARLAHVLGYVGTPNEEEAGRDPLMHTPGFKIGKNGIEHAYDKELRGFPGDTKVEVNAYGRIIRELDRDESTPGRDLQLTLDLELQKFAAERIATESASVVVMDVTNGDILAYASMPAYDPNDFNVGIRQAAWNMLLNDERHPLVNKPIGGTYPPGSTFKMITALAALEAGIITPDFRATCTGKRFLGNHIFHCWRKQGHGTLNLVDAICHSCDIYFYDIAERVGIDKIAEMGKRFGLGTRHNIGLPHEREGLMPTIAWKKKRYRAGWLRGETLVAGIGQGYVLTTPLQLAVMTARLAGGRAVNPRLVRSLIDAQTEAPELAISPVNFAAVRQGMIDVSNRPGATAYGARITEPGYSMAGKTGTAQVRRISTEERASGIRKNEDKPWIERDHALFVGFAPTVSPRYAVSVVVEHGGGGSKVAGPIARDVLLKAMQLDSGRPAVLPSARQMPPRDPTI
ncbi:penicillin-binding protein 2 [Govanella unica]|uniref:Penicillin-binding protein 2 n=1 Tax=Govanella unica TaxID=2975056 RepID=A0A9X3TXH4_9PROT|nr:penicillin-binding protein 2 [Govania unica]MDA5193478.1 penicillin-binding protein 2 [Govania unica]